MRITQRPYHHAEDYEKVSAFLVRSYRGGPGPVNWLQPRWEYMHFHPLVRDVDLTRIGVWEAGGEIVALVHPEHRMGQAYFELHPGHPELKGELLDHAEDQLADLTKAGKRLELFIHEADVELMDLADRRGYVEGAGEERSCLDLGQEPPQVAPPGGYRLLSLAEDNDLSKVHRVLWRGFGHGEEPPVEGLEEDLADRAFMQSAPNFRRDLNIVVEAPDGRFAAYAGFWIEPTHRVAYVEPVATDPAHRRLGLGKAAVLEGLRRCRAAGVRVAYVGSDQPFYLSMGFELEFWIPRWRREDQTGGSPT